MGRDDEFRPLRPDGDQGQADQRRPGGVELVGPVLGEEPVERRVRIDFAVAGQVDVPPGQGDVFGHDLHRITAGSGEERGAQVGVPVEQRLSGGPHARGVDVPGQMEHELHVVHVEGAVGERGLEQDPELARGLRPHLDQRAVAHLPGLDLVLPYRDERGVRGVSPPIRGCTAYAAMPCSNSTHSAASSEVRARDSTPVGNMKAAWRRGPSAVSVMAAPTSSAESAGRSGSGAGNSSADQEAGPHPFARRCSGTSVSEIRPR